MASLSPPHKSRRRSGKLWFERVMAIAAVTNLGLVLFDLSYVPWRDFWLRGTFQFLTLPLQVPLPPQLTQWYDPIKGIEPHRETQQYLAAVTDLEQRVDSAGLTVLETRKALNRLRRFSLEIIDDNPFQTANKSGTLEKIKNSLRDRIYEEQVQAAASVVAADPSRTEEFKQNFAEATTSKAQRSATTAFEIFWSQAYLARAGWRQEINWFNQKIRPLMATNYYRSISENGEFTNNFWVLEAPFCILFFLEFSARTFVISRRHTGVSWLDAMLWRWYDILLWFPFGFFLPGWAWIRVVPVAIRLHQAELLNLERVQQQVTEGFVANIAEEITEVVVLQVINQAQDAIKRGEISQWLLKPRNQAYVDINNVDEIAEISSLLIKLVVYQVFPKIQPDLEALLRHNVEAVLNQSPAYQAFKQIPAVGAVPIQLTERLVKEVTDAVYHTLTAALEDPVGAQLSRRLMQNFVESLGTEVQEQQLLKEIQALLADLLEEIKLSYVKQAAEVNVQAVLEQTRQLHQQIVHR